MTELENAIQKLIKNNQEQIIAEIEKMSKEEQKEIAKQIEKIDFEEVNKLYSLTKQKHTINSAKIEPITYIDKEKLTEKDEKKAKEIGENIIKNNQYAVVTMAGGQGTRLGWKGPKGTYKLDVGKNGKYIFEILAENLKKSKEKYGILPYWYIMTSEQNYDETVSFMQEHDFFGYEKEKLEFFKQGELPMLTENGKFLIENSKIKTGSNGNGGVYFAMKKQNIIADMKSKGIKWVYICGVDNIMVNPIDAIFIGLTVNNNMQVASKSVVKAYPEERVGVFCKRDGKPSTIEYIEMTEEMKQERNQNGELLYGEANFVSHLLSLNAIEILSEKTLQYHIAQKNGLYKFETFIFDAFEYFDDMLVMRVKREDEFAPIKNKEGVDSPETAKKIYERKMERDGKTGN